MGTATEMVAPRLTDRAGLAQLVADRYPPLLRDEGVAGEVRLRFRVLEDGTAEAGSITVLPSSAAEFGTAAAGVVAAMRFSPATAAGKPVAAWVETTIRFVP